MEFTEQEAAEAFGVEVEEHDEGGAAQEPGGDPSEGGGAAEGAETSPDGAETAQDGREDGAQGQDGQGDEEGQRREQSPEERHQQAAARRAREEAAREKAAQARVDSAFEEMFRGQVNPYTGRPITTEAEYRAYQAEQARQNQTAQLQKAGIDPATIEGIVDQKMAPMQQQLMAAQMENARRAAAAANEKAQSVISASLKNISAEYPEIKTLEDIAAMPTAERFNDLVQKGVSLEDAFFLANRKDMQQRSVAAAKAAAVRGAASRSHLNPVDSSDGKTVEVPASAKASFREMFPGATEAEIEKEYAAYLKELGR